MAYKRTCTVLHLEPGDKVVCTCDQHGYDDFDTVLLMTDDVLIKESEVLTIDTVYGDPLGEEGQYLAFQEKEGKFHADHFSLIAETVIRDGKET